MATNVDGIVFRKSVDALCPLKLTPAMGDWKDVFKGKVIEEFVALAPRITKFILRDSQTSELTSKVIVQSFSLESQTCAELFEEEDFLKMLNDAFEGRPRRILVPQKRKRTATVGEIATILKSHEFTGHLLTKRIVFKEEEELSSGGNIYKTRAYGVKKT